MYTYKNNWTPSKITYDSWNVQAFGFLKFSVNISASHWIKIKLRSFLEILMDTKNIANQLQNKHLFMSNQP